MTKPPPSDTAGLLRIILIGAICAFLVLAVALTAMLMPSFTASSSGPTSTGPAAAEVAAARDTAAQELTNVPDAVASVSALPSPNWIWTDGEPQQDQTITIRRIIDLPPNTKRVTLRYACDDLTQVMVSGEVVHHSDNWRVGNTVDLTSFARDGAIDLTIRATNSAGPAAFVAVIDIKHEDGHIDRIVSDDSWTIANGGKEVAATVIADLGAAPWGEVLGLITNDIERNIKSIDGFEVDLVYSVPRSQGSWVSLTADPKGRLISSDQSGGLFRITLPELDTQDPVIEPIDSPAGAAQGLLAIGNDLYCVIAAGSRAQGPGLYRLRDTDGDDNYDETVLLRKLNAGGEHGPHAIVQGPDGMLYLVAGNHTRLPAPEASTVPRHWGEDNLLPRLWDANGHARGIMAPGGWICRMDMDGTSWEVFACGFRNTYDIAFNGDGELFTYDADMEWDLGSPWYRPTRINHVVSGADYGWRGGTGKWGPHFIDSLPATLDIGPGSPTGVLFGTHARFPEAYQNALFAIDWTFGTIYAVHLQPDGATYSARRETFISGRPLPVADACINPADGNMYFVVGGRGLPSAIYRVRYTGPQETSPAVASASSPQRDLRKRLESYHNSNSSTGAMDDIWPALGNTDRWVRHAARVALEHQPVTGWIDALWAERRTDARLSGLVAAIRAGGSTYRDRILEELRSFDWDDLAERQQHDLLRCWTLAFMRLQDEAGSWPTATDRRSIARNFDRLYPAEDDLIDRQLCDLLVYLDSPTVVARTVPMMERMDVDGAPVIDPELLSRNDNYGSVIMKMAAAQPQRQQIYYALSLRNASRGWTPDLRERYFRWFETARNTSGGNSYAGFLKTIRSDALEQLPEADRQRYVDIGTEDDPLFSGDEPTPVGPGRQWSVDELLSLATEELYDRDFTNGQRMFAAAQCLKCHRFAGAGLGGGPDLTALSTRFALRDLAESLVEPSRTISDQYEQTEFLLDDDSIVIGRVIERDAEFISIMPTLLVPDMITRIAVSSVVEENPSAVSAMMPALLDRLNKDEVLDLMAYMLSEGDVRNPMFGQGE